MIYKIIKTGFCLGLSITMALLSHSVLGQTVTINGATLEYEILGDGKQTLLFEAGAISGMAGWDAIWNILPDNARAIRYSRRGEGNSSACQGDLTAKDYLKDLEALLKHLNISEPVISISHSYGSKIAREFAKQYPEKVSAMLFVDPINPRDVEIIELVDPIGGTQANEKLKQEDIRIGKENNWCLIKDIWDKSPSKSYPEIANIPVTLIAGVKQYSDPQRLFDTDKARELWGQFQSAWVNKFPKGKAVLAHNSGHFVQDDQPELVINELIALINKVTAHQ
ncbi:alpha/beta fold hydrolase [Thalassotalea ganghwensis]